MKLLVELPELIEDTVLVTPAIENLLKHHRNAEVTFVGSSVSTKLFENDKRVKNLIVGDTSNSIFSLITLFVTARSVGNQDLVVSFKNGFYTKFFLYFISCENKYSFVDDGSTIHKVEKYNNYINTVLNEEYKAGDLMLRFKPQWYKKPTFGIHPGSTYADVRRWDTKEFAQVALSLSSKYDIVLLGGRNEKDICEDIETSLRENGVENVQNFAAKTSISDLVEKIAGLDLFLTIDSGPMQIAAVYRVNSIIVPTTYKYIDQISQWNNPLETIIYPKDEFDEGYSEEGFNPNAQDVLKLFNI